MSETGRESRECKNNLLRKNSNNALTMQNMHEATFVEKEILKTSQAFTATIIHRH